MITEKVVTSGKRKEAVARAVVKPGNGIVTINKISHLHLNMLKRLMIEEPIRIAQENIGDLKWNIEVKVSGGGSEGRIEACRLAIARALLAATKQEDSKKADNLKKAYLLYDRTLLVADTRRKEAYKPGDSKARAKRQKSYR